MSDNRFLDTNILVYLVDHSDRRKKSIARDIVAEATVAGNGVISYQVVHEWFNTVFRKSQVRISREDAEVVYRDTIEPLWKVDSSRALIDAALHLFERNALSWWDALIVSAALQGNCNVLLSEDLQHGQTIAGVRIENPFL